MLKYSDFITESQICQLILESQVRFSGKFINTLSAINNPISKAILDLGNKEVDGLKYNYIDIDPKAIDEVSFIPDRKVLQLIAGKETLYKITDPVKHLKIDKFKKETGKARNTKIYEILGWDIKKARRANAGDEVRILAQIESPKGEEKKYYVLYESVKDPNIKAVINKDGLVESDDIFQKFWTTHRSSVKIGRLIRSFVDSTNNKFTDAEIEKFVNSYKSAIEIMNDAFLKFDIVSGEDIYYWYKSSNYATDSRQGTLGNSCMAGANKNTLHIYIHNPKAVQMVILYDDNGKIDVDKKKYVSNKICGRALLWTTVDDLKIMDRIYYIRDNQADLFKKFASHNGWWSKGRQQSGNNFTLECDKKSMSPRAYVIQLESWKTNFPYMDSFMYFNPEDGKLSNNSDFIKAKWALQNTDGRYHEFRK